ncbi:MAG: hypothetical protein QOE30_192 [Mycobacterium sp.]|nr:hypothetical protein [Mycobacterium sp.]
MKLWQNGSGRPLMATGGEDSFHQAAVGYHGTTFIDHSGEVTDIRPRPVTDIRRPWEKDAATAAEFGGDTP